MDQAMVPGFGVLGHRIEGYLTCWKEELGNHTLGMKVQNMHHDVRIELTALLT